MSIQRVWLFIAVATVVVLVGVLVALPAWASAPRQTDEPSPDAYTAMHEACEAGDVQGMSDAMDSLDEEGWEAMEGHTGDDHHGNTESHMAEEDLEVMEGHTGDGHHGAMGSGMMGSGGMMGTGTGMTGGMMGGQSGQGMMGW